MPSKPISNSKGLDFKYSHPGEVKAEEPSSVRRSQSLEGEAKLLEGARAGAFPLGEEGSNEKQKNPSKAEGRLQSSRKQAKAGQAKTRRAEPSPLEQERADSEKQKRIAAAEREKREAEKRIKSLEEDARRLKEAEEKAIERLKKVEDDVRLFTNRSVSTAPDRAHWLGQLSDANTQAAQAKQEVEAAAAASADAQRKVDEARNAAQAKAQEVEKEKHASGLTAPAGAKGPDGRTKSFLDDTIKVQLEEKGWIAADKKENGKVVSRTFTKNSEAFTARAASLETFSIHPDTFEAILRAYLISYPKKVPEKNSVLPQIHTEDPSLIKKWHEALEITYPKLDKATRESLVTGPKEPAPAPDHNAEEDDRSEISAARKFGK